jgi:predicted phosphodiesterase
MTWYRDPGAWLRALDEHGSINAVAAATGEPRSTLQNWARRHAEAARGVIPWGMGRAQQVRPATSEPWERVVFLSDVHVPYQDHALVASALDLVRRWEPHRVVLNGDIADLFVCSRFNTSSERMDSLQDDIDEANEFRRSVRDAAPGAVIDETAGNHDDRTVTYVKQNARALYSLRALQPENLFCYRELGIQWHPGAGFLLRAGFLVKHGTIIRGEAGATAKAELMSAGISGISGHTHRLATYRREGYVAREWHEQGCLCRADPDYIKGGVANWTPGIAIGEFSTRSDAFQVQLVPGVDGALRVLGAVAA